MRQSDQWSQYVRRGLGVLLVVIGMGCQAAHAKPQSAFCTQLQRINDGIDSPGDVPPYEHIVKVLDLLIPKAPGPLRESLTAMREPFAAVVAASKNRDTVLPAFAAISSPALIDAEHRVAEGIHAECGIVLGDPAKWPKDTAHSTIVQGEDRSICPGWNRQSNAVFGNRFPFTIDTSGANYWGFDYKVVPGGHIDIAGRYPHARYFSHLPNDMRTDNQHQLTDVHIDPDPGMANPWRDKNASKDSTFKIHFVFTPPPEKPAANTSYIALTKHGEPNAGGLFVYRIYGSDLGEQPNSAGVPLPAITVFDAAGKVTQHFDECQPYPTPLKTTFDDVPNFPPLPLPGSFIHKQPKLSASSTYDVPVDLLANPDVQYATFFFGHRFGRLFVIHGKALTTPDTRKGESPATVTDIEGWTMCNYNLLAGIAMTCRMDHDLTLDSDGYYTAVVSTDADRPRGTASAQSANWFDWGPYLDNQMTWRFFPRDNPKVKAITQALEGGAVSAEIDPYIPRGVYCDRATFEKGGWKACAQKAGLANAH